MTLKELEDIGYSRKHGYFIKEFNHRDKHYVAKLLPYPTKNAECVIREVTDKEDIHNITASQDAYVVYQQGCLPYNADSLRVCIKDFCKNY